MSRAHTRSGLIALIVLGSTLASPVHADSKAACLSAHTRGQLQRRDGQLKSALESFRECSAKACATLARDDCTRWGSEVEREIPTILLKVHDARGRTTRLEKLRIDGAELDPTLTDEPIALDPGKHSIKGFVEGGANGEAQIELKAGQKAFAVTLEIPAATDETKPESRSTTTTPAEAPEKPDRTLVYVAAAIGVVALGSFAFFGITGKNKQSELEKCAPVCDQSDVDVMRRDYLIANVSLGVAAIAAGASVWLWFSSSKSAAPARAKATRFAVSPLQRGMFVGAITAF